MDGLVSLFDELQQVDVDALLKGGLLGDDLSRDSQEELEEALNALEGRRVIGRKCKREPEPLTGEQEGAVRPLEAAEERGGDGGLAEPPRTALRSDLAQLHRPSNSENELMRITTQPPLEIRTRTKNENRTFSCVVQVLKPSECCSASVELCYATDTDTVVPTLGGTLTRPIEGGLANFDNLSVSVASPKHSEKEFVLKITLNAQGKARALRDESPLGDAASRTVYSTPFYAFSHKSVLKRRREVSLRALSHSAVTRAQASQMLHVVGMPFVRSDRLSCVLRVRRAHCDAALLAGPASLGSSGCETDDDLDDCADAEWVSIRAPRLEVYSDSVLFFQLPPELLANANDLDAFVQVTNDGRNFSNPLPLAVRSGLAPASKRHCAIRSRM